MINFSAPQGQFTLNRYPITKDKELRAWDAADEYLLLHLEEQQILKTASKVLIVNDAFGALTTALAQQHTLTSINDSFLSQCAITNNLQENKISTENITIQNTLEPLTEKYDVVVIKIPKNLAMLEDELYKIRNHCDDSTTIIAAAMNKHIHTSTLKLFERIIGTTKTSLARKKARLVMCEFNAALSASSSPYPGSSPYPSQYTLDVTDEKYFNHANVFSREKLDLGSRFMLQHIPQSGRYQNIIDLACGNGVLGITATQLNPMAKTCFVDESYMAVESAKINAKNLLEDNSNCEFNVTDCLQGIENDSIDLILNNPPFHQNHVVGDFIAWQMFNEAKQRLNNGGELIIVGNRHLGYHIKLKKLFGRCEMLANNKKFVVLKAIKK